MTLTSASLITDPYTFFNTGLLTRASVATRVNAAGVMETVPADNARLDHDHVTLQHKGLLIEESKTNMVLRSGSIGTTCWQIFNSTITAKSNVSPSGSTTASKIVANTTNIDHIVRRYVSLVATKTYTLTCFAKAAGQTFCKLFIFIGGTFEFANFYTDLTTRTATYSRNALVVKGASATTFPNVWCRCRSPSRMDLIPMA